MDFSAMAGSGDPGRWDAGLCPAAGGLAALARSQAAVPGPASAAAPNSIFFPLMLTCEPNNMDGFLLERQLLLTIPIYW